MVNYNNKYNVSDLPGAPFDWVLSVEVGEHIPVDGQNNFIGTCLVFSQCSPIYFDLLNCCTKPPLNFFLPFTQNYHEAPIPENS